MAISSSVLPSTCCGCSLRTAAIIIGSFSLVIAVAFLGLSAAGGSALNKHLCSDAEINGSWQNICINTSETHKIVVNLVTILAMLNATEAMMSIGLIWGACKRISIWITGWLTVSTFWIVLHSTLAIAYAFAATNAWVITLTAVLGIFFLGTALVSMLTVVSFQNEMNNSPFLSNEMNVGSAFHRVFARTLQPSNAAGTLGHPVGVCDETLTKLVTSKNAMNEVKSGV